MNLADRRAFARVAVFAACLNFANAAAPQFRAVSSSGWNEKAPVEFSVQQNRTFSWRSGSTERKGAIAPDVLANLISHVQAAKPGSPANDAGTLHITWRDGSGRKNSKVFYFPGSPPASELLQEISAIAEKYGSSK